MVPMAREFQWKDTGPLGRTGMGHEEGIFSSVSMTAGVH